jgi:hypothetical protein
VSRRNWNASARNAVLVTGALLLVGIGAMPANATSVTRGAGSHTEAGYNVSPGPPGSVTSISATVVMPSPSFTCHKPSDAIIANASITDSVSGLNIGPLVWLECSKKDRATYLVQFVTPSSGATSDASPGQTINAGDVLVMSVGCMPDSTSVGIEDETTPWGTTAVIPGQCDGYNAFVGDIGPEKGGGPQPRSVPAFGQLDWSNVSVNGSALGSLAPTASDLYKGRRLLIRTGAITSDGTAFETTQAN